MRAFFQKLAYRFQRFMTGRYGQDAFSRFLTVVTFVLLILSVIFRPLQFLLIPAWILLIYSTFRMFSKNIAARVKERDFYLNIRNRIVRKWKQLKSRWTDRKEYSFYRCPNCGVTVRIRKPGKHKTIMVTCPKCHEEFRKKT